MCTTVQHRGSNSRERSEEVTESGRKPFATNPALKNAGYTPPKLTLPPPAPPIFLSSMEKNSGVMRGRQAATQKSISAASVSRKKSTRSWSSVGIWRDCKGHKERDLVTASQLPA